jgi:hypothetical protein
MNRRTFCNGEKKKMSPRKITAAATAIASIVVLSLTGAQGAQHHMHHHKAVATAAPEETMVVGTASAVPGYYAPSQWGDFDCQPDFPGCRPYAAKDWSKP